MTGQIQRRLMLVRHAKAIEDDTGGDHARPLSARGREDAAALGAWLAEQGICPDQACCSTAVRTRETLALICSSPLAGEARRGGVPQGQSQMESPLSLTLPRKGGGNIPTILREKLYLAPANEMMAQVHGADDAVCTLMLVGHNPGLHGLLATLVDAYADENDAERVIMKFPTAACAVLRFELDHWRDLKPRSGVLEKLRWSVDG